MISGINGNTSENCCYYQPTRNPIPNEYVRKQIFSTFTYNKAPILNIFYKVVTEAKKENIRYKNVRS